MINFLLWQPIPTTQNCLLINYKNTNQHHGKFKHTKTPTTTTSNQQTQPKCKLCNNQHPNPWYTTDNCPFKDPKFIQNTLIRENVMQHNTLYEKINRDYTKNLYNQKHIYKSLQATIPKTAKLAEISSGIPDIPDKDSSDLIDLQDDAFQISQIIITHQAHLMIPIT
jgi:hypothetical protein